MMAFLVRHGSDGGCTIDAAKLVFTKKISNSHQNNNWMILKL